MQIRYPKSFFKLLFAGFLLAVLPLVVGLLANTVAIQRLSSESQRAIYDAARVVHDTRELSESAMSLERAARQSTVLHDPMLWQGYLTLRQRFNGAATRMGSLPMPAAMRAQLDALVRREQQLFADLGGLGPNAPQAADVAQHYAEIADAARTLLAQTSGAIDQEAEALGALAEQTESRGRMQLFLLLPVAVFVVAGFTYLLARPIAQIEQGIRDLGEGRFERKLEVNGPEDLEQLGRQLDWLRLRLVQLEEQKSRFLRHISHELKTPLTALREGSNLLAEEIAGPLNERQKEIVHILRQHSLDLQRLIEDLLRHGEAEFQQAPLKLQALRPAEIIGLVLHKQAMALSSRELHLRIDAEDFLMLTDPERLRIVLDNLISNAIKYSPPGGTVAVVARRAGGSVLIEVSDDGPGVAPEDRGQVFDPFYRGSATAGGSVKGSGLGLSIAKEHVLVMGGEIGLGPGRSQFTVKLPMGAV